jgi:hypothetical protein
MSATRIIFIAVCAVLGVLVFTIGFVIRRSGDNSMSIAGLLSRSRENRRKRPILPKTAAAYFTIVLTLAAIALIVIFRRR